MGFFSSIFGATKSAVKSASVGDVIAGKIVYNNMKPPAITAPIGYRVVSVSPTVKTPVLGEWKIKYEDVNNPTGTTEFKINKNTRSRSSVKGNWKFKFK
jgi:hypothetical protein